MRDTVARMLRDHYVSVANELLTPLQVLMTTARADFGGDLDKFIVLMEIALRTTMDRRTQALTSREVLSGAVAAYPSLGTNIRSVAQSSGIPRETVRRKVIDLLQEGWVERQNNTLGLTPKASTQLKGVRDAVFDLAARNFLTVNGLIERDRAGG